MTGIAPPEIPDPENRTTGRKAFGLSRNMRVVAVCVALLAGMSTLAASAVPLYNLFCRVTGYGGTTQRAEAAPSAASVLGREVTVRFDSTNVHKNLLFKPKQRTIRLRIGETRKIYYIAENKTDKRMETTASFNVSPGLAGRYFSKIECFCFTEQVLEPRQRVEMPVVFYIDPEMALDKDLAHISTITLSYTIFITDEPAQPVAVAPGSKQSKENL